MLKTTLAGVVALATIGCLSIGSGGIHMSQSLAQEPTASIGGDAVIVTEAKIARLKRVLRLTTAQETHWHPVEAALRRLMHAARRDTGSDLVQRVRDKVSGYAVSAAALQQVSSAAQPLIATLDEQQKQDGMRLIREIGLGAQ